MSLSSYNPHDRYRRRNMQRLISFCMSFAVIACAGAFGFWIGQLRAGQEIMTLTADNKALARENDDLQNVLTSMRAEVQTTNTRFEQLKEAYEQERPEGPEQELTALLKQQLSNGVDAKRLESVIRSASPPRNCTDPETKRFVVSTPVNKGPDSQVSIGNGVISITGSGASAYNEKGQPEAWYDPAKQVAIEFKLQSGAVQKKTGVLPLSHTIATGGREYRFTISEGVKSFAKVAFDSCDSP